MKNPTVYRPYAQRGDNNRQPVEIELSPDVVDIEIDYQAANGSITHRRIKPLGLRFLKEGEIAIVARCRLRDEHRTFAFNRISSVSFPGFSSKVMTGQELISLFHHDLERLFAHEVTVNGPKPSSSEISRGRVYDAAETSSITLDVSVLDEENGGTVKVPSGVAALCSQIHAFIDDVSTDAPKPHFCITVTIQLDGQSAPEVFVDVPTWVANQGRDGSSHARMAYMQRRQGIVKASREFLASLRSIPGALHETSSIRISANRTNKRDKKIFHLCLDDIFIHPTKLAGSTLGQYLVKRIANIPQNQHTDLPMWMMDTDMGPVRTRAQTPQDAVTRISALSGAPVTVYAIGEQVELPVPLPIRRSKAA